MVDINIETILEMLSQLIGIEGAEKILNEAIMEARLPIQPFYSEPEFQTICENLKAKGGSIKIFAALVMTSEYREKQYQRIINKERKQREELAQLYGKMEELNSELQLSNDRLKMANESLKQMQDELVKAEKMATLGQLASSIAHELRNPLAGIKNIKYYLSRYLKSDDPKVIEFLDLLSEEIDRTNRIVSELLDFSQVKKYHKINMDINELLEQFINNMNDFGNVTIAKELSPGAGQVNIDQDKLRQVFLNLVSNASDAMGGNGTVTISTSVDKVYEPGKEYASVVFKDTGCGMSRETLDHIFEPLFTTKMKGIGLGLPIIKDIVEQHGGKLLVESEKGKGSKFTVLLPLAPA